MVSEHYRQRVYRAREAYQGVDVRVGVVGYLEGSPPERNLPDWPGRLPVRQRRVQLGDHQRVVLANVHQTSCAVDVMERREPQHGTAAARSEVMQAIACPFR